MAIVDTAFPTPAAAKTAPSAASICGSTAAHPTWSSSRRASRTGVASPGRSITIATVNAMIVASARATSVTCFGSTSATPPMRTSRSVSVPTSASTGISNAGMNNLFPHLAALAWRDSSLVLSPPPRTPRVLATIAIAITIAPVAASARYEPNRNVTAHNPQNVAFAQRRGCAASSAFTTATPAARRPVRI